MAYQVHEGYTKEELREWKALRADQEANPDKYCPKSTCRLPFAEQETPTLYKDYRKEAAYPVCFRCFLELPLERLLWEVTQEERVARQGKAVP